jgi:DNA mismatch endonuclease, patch repair protein
VSTTQPSDGSDAPRPLNDTTRQRLQRQPRQDTHPELELRRALHRRGLRYRIERQLLPNTRRRVDIVFPAQCVAVFVDGCFWHSCPEHRTVPKNNRKWWESKLQANVERDRDTDRRLIGAGWLVIRVWEHETPDAAADRIESAVRSRMT